MFLDHNETSPSITAVSARSVACSMLAVQQQKRLCRQFVDVSAAQRGSTDWVIEWCLVPIAQYTEWCLALMSPANVWRRRYADGRGLGCVML